MRLSEAMKVRPAVSGIGFDGLVHLDSRWDNCPHKPLCAREASKGREVGAHRHPVKWFVRQWADELVDGPLCRKCVRAVHRLARERTAWLAGIEADRVFERRFGARRNRYGENTAKILVGRRDRVIDVLPAQLFAYPTDIGNGHRCDMCGTKCFDQRRCSECGYQFESDHQVSTPGGHGFTGMMEALR